MKAILVCCDINAVTKQSLEVKKNEVSFEKLFLIGNKDEFILYRKVCLGRKLKLYYLKNGRLSKTQIWQKKIYDFSVVNLVKNWA